MLTSPPQVAFSSGEIAPSLYARSDYQRTQTGLRTCRGWIPLRQGGITRAPGTFHLGSTLGNVAARLMPFQFAVNDACVLEFTPLKMRVWRYGALVESGGSPYELTTPYDAADLPGLQFVQSADVLYIVDGSQPMQRLSRFALDNWTIAPVGFTTGPFRVQNADTAATITPSAATGTVALTASTDTFESGHVGALFQLEPADWGAVSRWRVDHVYSLNDLVRYDGNLYRVTTAGDSKGNPPIHLEGTEKPNPDSAIEYLFVSDGKAIVQITAVASATSATATVLTEIPAPIVANGTYRWSEGAWSDARGYPSSIEIYEQRLFAAGTPSDPRTFWASVAGAFDQFTPGTLADDSFAFAIGGSQSRNAITWLKAGATGLHVGAGGEAYTVRAATTNGTIGPTNIRVVPNGTEAAALAAAPIAPDGRPIFISADGRRVLELQYSLEEDRNRPIELSLPSEHLGNEGFAEIVWQGAGYRLAWLRADSGILIAMVYDPAEDVLGWAPVPVAGGAVQSICVTLDAATASGVLSLCVKRTIDGADHYFVEQLAAPFLSAHGQTDATAACHLYAATAFANDPETDTMSVPHLSGATVSAWTEAGTFDALTVAGDGSVTLPQDVGSAVIGLFDDTHAAETLDIPAATQAGDSRGRYKRLTNSIGVTLLDTCDLRLRGVGRSLNRPTELTALLNPIEAPIMDELVTPRTGVTDLPLSTGSAREQSIEIRPVGGAPATVTGLIPGIREVGP